MLNSVVLSTIVLLLLWRLFFHKIANFVKVYQFSKTVPGPTFLETIKNANRSRILPFLLECIEKYGSKFCIWLGTDLAIFITDPEDVRAVLSSQEMLHKSKNYKIERNWLGDGLLLAGGEKWQKSRKLLTPAFHFNILKEFKSAMDECCEVLITKLDTVATGQSIDMYPYMALFALDVIFETALGTKKNAQEKSDSEYVKAVKEIFTIFHKRTFNFLLRSDLFYKFSKLYQKEKCLLKILHGETNRVIEQRRSEILSWNLESTDKVFQSYETEYGRKRRLAFLDMLIIGQMEGKNITDKQIREEVDTFMVAGHDTTSTAMSFAIYELSRHPECQQKAYLEALEFQGRENEPMKYLEAVIKETIRLYPALAFFSRNNNEEFKLGKHVLPKGLVVAVFAFGVHRSPNLYENPNEFNPERFLNEQQYHAYSHVGFSAGPRNCIGQRFAMLEMKTALSSMLRQFKFSNANVEVKLLPEILLKSDNGVKVVISRRS